MTMKLKLEPGMNYEREEQDSVLQALVPIEAQLSEKIMCLFIFQGVYGLGMFLKVFEI